MVKLKTKQNKIYAISESVRDPKGGNRYCVSVPFCIMSPKLIGLFTILPKTRIPEISIKAFKTEILQKVRHFLETCVSMQGYSELCCDSHIWANKMEIIRRLSDGGRK